MDRDLRLSKTENKDLYAKHEQLRMKNLELEKELANKNSKLEKFESENVDCHNKVSFMFGFLFYTTKWSEFFFDTFLGTPKKQHWPLI